jgi:hypothetical protein
MKKLRLEIDEIQVETFETGDEESTRGTVHGHHPTAWGTCTCECSHDGTCDPDWGSGHQYSCSPTMCNETECEIFCPYTYNPYENPAC